MRADPIAETKARLQLRSLLTANPEEARAANARIRSRLERRRSTILHERQAGVENTLIAIERSKRRALRYLSDSSERSRPPRQDQDARGMAACGLSRLRRVNSDERAQVLEELSAIDSLEACTEVYARRLLQGWRARGHHAPSLDDLKRERRDQLTRTDSTLERPGFLIARELAGEIEAGVGKPRATDEWLDIAQMLLIAGDPDTDPDETGLDGLLSWGAWSGDVEDLFRDPQGIRAWANTILPEDTNEALGALTRQAALNLGSVLGSEVSHVPQHLQRARAKRAHAAEQRVRKGDLGLLRELAGRCTRHRFPSEFLPMKEGETEQGWMARCDWGAYARGWVEDRIRPFLRDLRLKAACHGIDPIQLLAYTSSQSDEGQTRVQYMAGFTSRMYTSLDDPAQQVDLEEELAATLPEDFSWYVRYHDIFEVVDGRLLDLQGRGPAAQAPPEDGDSHSPAPVIDGPALSPEQNRELAPLLAAVGGRCSGKRAERVKGVLECLASFHMEWLTSQDVKEAGLSPATVYARCRSWTKGEQYRGAPGRQREYSRDALMRYVAYEWTPKRSN